MWFKMMDRIGFALVVFLTTLISLKFVVCEPMFSCDSLRVQVSSTEITFASQFNKNRPQVQEIQYSKMGFESPMNTISINPIVSPSTVIPLISCTKFKLKDERRFTVCPPRRGLIVEFCDQKTTLSLQSTEFGSTSYKLVVKNGKICEAIIYDKASTFSETNSSCPLIPAAVSETDENRVFEFDSGTLGIGMLSRDLMILKETIGVELTAANEETHVADFTDAEITTEPINNVQVKQTEATKVLVSWTYEHPTTGFTIYVESKGVGLPPVPVSQNEKSHPFTDLKPFEIYTFKVIANIDTTPEDVGTKEFRTWPGLPATPQLRTDLVYADGNKIEVNWDAVVEFNGEFETYEIVAKVGSEIVDSINSTDTRCTLEKKIAFESTYEVLVRAFTKPNEDGEGGGSGLYSNPETVKTESQKQNVKVEQTALNDVVVSWKYNGSNSDIQVRPSLTDTKFVIEKVAKNANYTKFVNLDPYTLYTFNAFSTVVNPNLLVGSKVYLTWPGIPDTPSLILNKVFAEQNKIQVEWNPTEFFGDVDTYEAVAKKGYLTAASCKTTLLMCVLSEGLQYPETYDVSVRAITRTNINGKGGGTSAFSEPKKVTTKSIVPNGPLHLTLTRPNERQVAVTWLPNPKDSHPYIFYSGEIHKTGVKMSNGKNRFSNKEADPNITFIDLLDFETYNVSVKACFSLACSQPLMGSIRTLPGTPEIPTDVTAVEQKAKEITVSWLNPEVKNGPLDNVTVAAYSKNEQVGICSGALEVQNCTINGLAFFTEYIIRARACNAPENNLGGGCSGLSNDVELKTRPGKPDPPFDVKVSASAAKQLSVSWTNPINANGPLDNVTAYAFKDEMLHGQCEAVHPATACVIQNLEVNTKYEISTKAYNAAFGVFDGAFSNPSTPVLAKTLPDKLSSNELNLISNIIKEVTGKVNDSSSQLYIDLTLSILRSSNIGLISKVTIVVHKSDQYQGPNEPVIVDSSSRAETGFVDGTYLEPMNGSYEVVVPLKINSPDSSKLTDVVFILGEPTTPAQNNHEYNGPLLPGTKYKVQVRIYTETGYGTTAPVLLETSENPVNIGLIVGIVILGLVVIGLIIFIICFIKRKKGDISDFSSLTSVTDESIPKK